MPFLDITASNAASTGVSSPFENNAYLIVGSNPSVSGAGGYQGPSTAEPTSTATTNRGTLGSVGVSPGDGYGVTPQTLTGSLGNLLNNTTFWLALGAAVTLLLVLKRKKG